MIKKILFILFLVAPLFAQEQVNLTTPETKPNTTFYRIERLTITFDNPITSQDEGAINIQLIGENTEHVSCLYNSTSATTGTVLVNGLNKANLSTAYASNATTGSLKQRIFHRLVIMNEGPTVCGKTFSGTLAGSVP